MLSPVWSDPRYQHNVWYNGLFISGLAVDESTGDVYFSDAAQNRIVHQSKNGTLLGIYRAPASDDLALFSPMQLVFVGSTLYFADSDNGRVGVVHTNTEMAFLPKSEYLSSCSAVAVDGGGALYVIDGWGLMQDVWSSGSWSNEVDFSKATPVPLYFSSAAVVEQTATVVDPVLGSTYIGGESVIFDFTVPGALSIDYHAPNSYYFLIQATPDAPMQVALTDLRGAVVESWTAPGRGGRSIPFFGSSMYYAASDDSIYLTDHGTDDSVSSYGRVVKMNSSWHEVGNWTITDGAAFSFTSVWYDGSGAAQGGCSMWMTDPRRGVVRVAADGTLLQWHNASVDPADNRTARFTAVALDLPSTDSVRGYPYATLVLLDTAAPTHSKLWRFSLDNLTFSLINTSTALLSPHILGLTVDNGLHDIYVVDADQQTVIRLNFMGEPDSLNLSSIELVEPQGLVVYLGEQNQYLFVADAGYNGTGAVVVIDEDLQITRIFQPDGMYRPLSVVIDASKVLLYAADSNGVVYQSDVGGFDPAVVIHQPVPAALEIRSMAITRKGVVYMLDVYSRRLIVLLWEEPPWNPGPYECAPVQPATLSSSSSSSSSSSFFSSSTADNFPRLSSSSSSSSSFLPPSPQSTFSLPAAISLVLLCVLLLAAARIVMLRFRRKRKRRQDDRLLQINGKEVYVEAEESEEQEAMEWEENEAVTAIDQLVDNSNDVDMGNTCGKRRPSGAARTEYHIQRYEVVTALEYMLSPTIITLQSTSPHPASISTSDPLSSTPSSSSFPDENHDAPPQASDRRPASSAVSPSHIAELTSVLQTVPTFIQSVQDLTILGEGSSGRVYTGRHPASGAAVVVKLPKVVTINGATWREWHCHIRLPPHPHLVNFLGALPMSSNNYLVTALVRQGSLHGLLTSPSSSTGVYSRPYGVLRCAREMAAVLAHMHLSGFVHRDVSTRNILVDSDGRYVLADLGLAHQVNSKDDTQSALPVRWTSPESLASGRHSAKSDVWSLGVALWEMTSGGRLPYSDSHHSLRSCIPLIVTGQLTLEVDLQWPATRDVDEKGVQAERELAARLRSLIQLCLSRDEQRRPDSKQLVEVVEKLWDDWSNKAHDNAVYDRKEVVGIERHWVEHHRNVPLMTESSMQRGSQSKSLFVEEEVEAKSDDHEKEWQSEGEEKMEQG